MLLIDNNAIHSLIILVVSMLLVSACSSSATHQKHPSNSAFTQNNSAILKDKDPLEKFNRRIFAFNLGLDNHLLKPVAKAYKAVAPNFVDTSVTNFFENLGDVQNAINNVLQFKFIDAVNDTERFVVNSTLGFAGLLDIASAAGLEKHDEDFGQTLARWGVKSGPYLMLPFLGPSTVRDATAKISVDRYTDLTHYSDESISFFVLKTIDKRADFLSQEDAFKDLSDDQYSALRDVWLQQRAFLVSDGKVNKKSASDLIDELERLELE